MVCVWLGAPYSEEGARGREYDECEECDEWDEWDECGNGGGAKNEDECDGAPYVDEGTENAGAP